MDSENTLVGIIVTVLIVLYFVKKIYDYFRRENDIKYVSAKGGTKVIFEGWLKFAKRFNLNTSEYDPLKISIVKYFNGVPFGRFWFSLTIEYAETHTVLSGELHNSTSKLDAKSKKYFCNLNCSDAEACKFFFSILYDTVRLGDNRKYFSFTLPDEGYINSLNLNDSERRLYNLERVN